MVTNVPRINRKFKDRLFRMVFQSKKDLLELYNAINGTSYTNPDELEINTLDDVIYMGMKNDSSFLIDNFLNLYEHQSTYNPNLPARGLLYFADLYRSYMARKKLNLYSSSLQKLPVPKFVVFYNGKAEEPDRQELKLSDAFEIPEDGELPAVEVRVVMLNINWGHNWELMEKCRRLKEYSQFVACVREYIENGLTPAQSVDQAVDECIRSGILEEFLRGHRAEVMDVILTEYNEQEHLEMERNEWEAKGLAEGLAEGLTEKSKNVIKNMLIQEMSDADIMLLVECDQAMIDKVRSSMK